MHVQLLAKLIANQWWGGVGGWGGVGWGGVGWGGVGWGGVGRGGVGWGGVGWGGVGWGGVGWGGVGWGGVGWGGAISCREGEDSPVIPPDNMKPVIHDSIHYKSIIYASNT